MKLFDIAVRRPVTILMLALLLMTIGIQSIIKIPIDFLPEIDPPNIVVSTNYSGTAPQEIEELITKPLEEALSKCRGLEKISSRSREGNSIVMLEFGWTQDMDFVNLDVRDKLAKVTHLLPGGRRRPDHPALGSSGACRSCGFFSPGR